MGVSSSKLMAKPNNPLQELQWLENRRDRMKKQIAKRKRKLYKQQNKHVKRKELTKNITNVSLDFKTNQQNNNELVVNNLNNIRQQYKTNLYKFLTNQIAFATEFYRNFDRDIKQTSEQLLRFENELNQNLEQHSVLLTNICHADLVDSVYFYKSHKLKENENNQFEVLQLQRLYIVFENIEITQPHEANYVAISKCCKVNMQAGALKSYKPSNIEVSRILQAAKWKGFLRLKLTENINHCQTDNYMLKSSSNSIKTQSSCSGYATDTDYDYIYKAYKPLNELKSMENASDELYGNCVSDLSTITEITNETSESDYESEQEENSSNQIKDKNNLLYLNSAEFMQYFANLFQQQLANKLCICRQELQNAIYSATAIYTNRYEILPAIYVPHNVQAWPECAYKFKIRQRKWPTRQMIGLIESFGCHLIPLGYAPKQNTLNPLRSLEWCIVFPKAERYLMQQLNSVQVKVFILAQILLKTFFRHDIAQHNMQNYLRTHLFWECERDFDIWQEQLVGDLLLRFIKTFMQRVREKFLPDFFIEQRNMFENVPDYVLSQLNEVLAHISANPLMHLLLALRQINFAAEFFPKINLHQIFTLLTEMNTINVKRKTTTKATIQHKNSAELQRHANLLEIFMQQLLAMSEKALAWNSLRLASNLLKQARNLLAFYKDFDNGNKFSNYEQQLQEFETQLKYAKADYEFHEQSALPKEPLTAQEVNKFKIDISASNENSLSYA